MSSSLVSTSTECLDADLLHHIESLMQTLSSIFISTDGPITPTKLCSIRHITAQVGAAVVRAAVAEDLAEGCCDVGPRELGSMSEVPRYI